MTVFLLLSKVYLTNSKSIGHLTFTTAVFSLCGLCSGSEVNYLLGMSNQTNGTVCAVIKSNNQAYSLEKQGRKLFYDQRCN